MTIAAALLAIALQGAAPAAADAAPAPTHTAASAALPHLTGIGEPRFRQCLTLIDQNPDHAYEEAMAWAAETHEIGAYRCAGMALIAENHYEEGARRLQSLATTISGESNALRAELLSQAGNAYLLAYEPSNARSALTEAIAVMHSSPEQLPDLLIDRARAYAMERDYRHAEEDLSHSLDIRPQDALALRLRASARMHQNAFELAEADAQAAVNLEPTNVDALLMLGHAKESRRTGHAVEEQ